MNDIKLNDVKLINDNIKIRKIELKDVENTVLLINECWKKAYKEIMSAETLIKREESNDKRIEKWKKELNKRNIFVVEFENKIVGCCEYILNSDIKNADCEISILYVDINYQSLGIGRTLVEFVKSRLKKLDKKAMIIRCLEENVNARNFYKKIGGIELNEIVYFEFDTMKYKEKIYLYEI